MRRDSWLQPWRNIRPMKHASELDLPKLLTREHHKIHLIGVAGSGMSGIAALLLELGHEVSGSDKTSTVETDRLRRLGLRFHQNHHADDASDADLIVFSSAIAIDNPILLSARDFGKPAVRRAEVLAAIMRTKRAILIAGMHGKTTTSAMTAHVLREAGLHPSHYVGAEIPILGRMHIGIRSANILLRKATKATGRCAAFTQSTPSF